MGTTRVSPVSFLKISADVASFYGFRPAREIEKRAAEVSKVSLRGIRTAHTFATTAQMATVCATGEGGQPVLVFYATPTPTHMPSHLPERETAEFGLQIVGTSESVGEIILFKTIATILNEWGTPLRRVRLNALGDRESRERFMRELTLHVRKHTHRLPEEYRVLVSTNPSALYGITHEEAQAIVLEAPRSINFLTEKSRAHFRSILEYLEELGLPYELDERLVGDERAHHIAFAVDLDEDDATVVGIMGGRYDDFLKTYTRRVGSSGVGASIFFRKKGASRGSFAVHTPQHKPKIYFAQLGLRAKLQGLGVLEMLRSARIPVEQSFDAAHLSSQLAQARIQGVTHLLIMGQREALDGTVIVRTMQNSAQSTLPLCDMPRFLKTLR
jgi:histidyl-tRNA synthetase